MSKLKEGLLNAYNKGYRINERGEVTNAKNVLVKGGLVEKKYKRFSCKTKEKSIGVLFHRLQAYQKYGDEIFKEGIVVRHLNGNSLDNSYDNIVIGTCFNNSMDRPKEQRILNASNPIYNHEFIIEDRSKGMTYKELMIKYKISSKGTLSFIINKSLEKTKKI